MKTIFVRLQLNSCLIKMRFIVLFSADEHITCYSIQLQYDYNTNIYGISRYRYMDLGCK